MSVSDHRFEVIEKELLALRHEVTCLKDRCETLEDKLKDVRAQASYSAKVARQSKHLKK